MPFTGYTATVSGGECVFPFTHEGHQYEECTSHGGGAPWCVVKKLRDGEALGKALSPQTLPSQKKMWDGESMRNDLSPQTISSQGPVLEEDALLSGSPAQVRDPNARVDPALGSDFGAKNWDYCIASIGEFI